MSCMSAYSMPLCTILTKCPAPSGPTWVQHGSPSTWAAMLLQHRPERRVRLGRAARHDARPVAARPPRHRTRRCRRSAGPRSRSASSRRRVSTKCALPPSMTMSPSSSSGTSSSITASVGSPALTMMIDLRGRSRAGDEVGSRSAGTNSPSWPNSSTSSRRAAGAVVDGDRTVAGQVTGQVAAHHREAGDADLRLRHAQPFVHLSSHHYQPFVKLAVLRPDIGPVTGVPLLHVTWTLPLAARAVGNGR